MNKINASQLFIIRHGFPIKPEGLVRRLDTNKVKQLEPTARAIEALINKEWIPKVVSSPDRIAIETAFALGDLVKRDGKRVIDEFVRTNRSMFTNRYNNEFIDFCNSFVSSGQASLIATANLEFVQSFPSIYLRYAYGANCLNSSDKFGEEYGSGVYIDLQTGKYKKIPF